MLRRPAQRSACLLALALGLREAPPLHAQVRGVGARTITAAGAPQFHDVDRGENLSVIAQRYGVTVHQLAERNHLAPPYALRTGQRLRLPHAAAPPPQTAARPLSGADGRLPGAVRPLPGAGRPLSGAVGQLRGAGRPGSAGRLPPEERGPPSPPVPARALAALERSGARGTPRYGRPRRPGMVSLRRVSSDERVTTLLRRPNRGVLALMRRFLRANGGESHPIDPRLLRQLAIVSDHFGGRVVQVISGFRPFRRGQHTAHSNHNVGHAIDFRVEGVRNRDLWDYCRTLPGTGCGFYPRSVFVHMDVRSEPAVWVDWSRPGERPRYGSLSAPPAPPRPGAPAAPAPGPEPTPHGADPELDDVAAESPHIRTATPEPEDDHSATGSPLPPPPAGD